MKNLLKKSLLAPIVALLLDGGELRDVAGKPVIYEPGAYTVRTHQKFVSQSIVDQAHLNGGGVCTVGHAGSRTSGP
jgi:hypothetical protein